MPKKSTSNLENELKKSVSIEAFLQEHHEELAASDLPAQLQDLIASKGLTKADVVKESNLNEIYAYQILSGARRPSRDKLLSICFAMKATLDETQNLLRQCGFAPLYVKNRRDSIIIFALAHNHSIIELNSALYDHGEAVVE